MRQALVSTSSPASSAVHLHSRPCSSRRPIRTCALFGFSFGGGAKQKAEKREQLKSELLDLIAPLQRGVAATAEDKAAVDRAASALEKLNPNPKSLCELLTGKWELLYTTSDSILGKSKPAPFRPWGKIYQTIDVENLKARNIESAPFFNQVAADLTPTSASEVFVQFTQFKIFGLIPVTAPESAQGTLDITYLDDDLRVSRGNRENLFVLRMVDRNSRP